MTDFLKEIIGSIASGIILVVLIIAFVEINDTMKKSTDSPQVKEQIENNEKSFFTSINIFLLVGGIADILLLVGFIYFIFKDSFDRF